jgi:hypothetical protein
MMKIFLLINWHWNYFILFYFIKKKLNADEFLYFFLLRLSATYCCINLSWIYRQYNEFFFFVWRKWNMRRISDLVVFDLWTDHENW